MICRMTLQQRNALINMIDAKIVDMLSSVIAGKDRNVSAQAEEIFHNLFANEDTGNDQVKTYKVEKK